MTRTPRPGARPLAVLAALAVTGLGPAIAAGPALADGPVWTPSKSRATPAKQKPKKPAVQKAKPAKKAKIGLTVAGPTTPVIPGKTYTWPYSVTNSGQAKAGTVTFQAPLPAALEFVSAQGNCSWQGSAAVCQLGSLLQGQTLTGSITAKIAAGAVTGAAIAGSATVRWEGGQVAGRFPATSVAPVADVSVTKAGPVHIRPGQTAAYKIEVQNNGPAPAAGVVVSDVARAVPVKTGQAVPFEVVTATSSCAISGVTLSCDLGTLAVGAKQTVGVQIKAGPGARPGTVFTSPAVTRTTTYEQNLANNRATARTKVVAPAAVANQALAELPATGGDTRVLLDAGLGLLGVGLIMIRLGARRRRPVA